MLAGAVDDRVHRFLDRLILQRNANDPGKALAAALQLAIEPMVVRLVLDRPPASHPVVRARQIFQRPRQTRHNSPVGIFHRLEPAARPLQVDVEDHRMLVVDRHPGIGRQIAFHRVARIGHPERKDETRKAMMVVAGHGVALGGIHRPERHLADIDARRLVQHRVGRRIVRMDTVDE